MSIQTFSKTIVVMGIGKIIIWYFPGINNIGSYQRESGFLTLPVRTGLLMLPIRIEIFDITSENWAF